MYGENYLGATNKSYSLRSWYFGVSEVADFESLVRFSKFKIADRDFKKFSILMKICIWEFSEILILRIRGQILIIQNNGSNMVV